MGTWVVTGPDGKEYEVDAPNEEAVKSAVDQMFGGTGKADGSTGSPGVEPPPGSMPKEPSLIDRIMSGAKTTMGVLDQGVRGVADGMANVIGLPGDIGKATGLPTPPGTGSLAGIPFPTSETLKSIPNKLNRATADTLGVDRPREKPDGPGERTAYRVGEEIGAMMVPTGAATQAAKPGIEAVRAAMPASRGNWFMDFVRQAPNKMVQSAAVDGGKFIGKETAAATAAGLGASTVNELITGKAQAEAAGVPTTTAQEVGDLIGAIMGVGTAGAAKKITDTVGTVAGAVTGNPNRADSVIKDVAVDEIARAAGLKPAADGSINTAPLVAQIEGAPKISDTIPGFKESLADRTKSPDLAATEYARQSGPNSGQYAGRRAENTNAIDNTINKSEPQATPGQFRDELELERDRRLTDAGVATANATDAADEAARTVTPAGTPGMRGNTIRTEAETARQTARDATNQAYEAAGINDNPLAPTTLAEALDRVTASLPHADRVDTPQALIDRIANLPAGEPLTMREAAALKTRLLGLQEAAAAEPGGRNAVRVLGQYIDAVEEVIQGGISAEQRAALGEARGLRRAEGDAFERKGDPVADILATRPGGVPRMRDENVASLATRPDALGRILEEADTPATRQAIRDQLLSNADTSTAEGIQRFVQENAEQLRRFPGLAEELGRAQTARGAQAAAQRAETELQREIGAQGRGVVAKYLAYGNENANKAMRMVLADKDPARAADELLAFVGDDPKAVEGARKVFWDIMQDKTRSGGSSTKTLNGKQPFLPAALDNFVNDPAIDAVAARLWRDNLEHWENIKKVSAAIQGVDTRNAAKAPNSSGTPQALQSGSLPTPETLASRIFAVERGVVSPTFAIANVLGIMARKMTAKHQVAAVNSAIDKALLDPEWAAQLLKENNPANRAALYRRATGWMGNEASTLVNLLSDDPDRDTKDAAMRSGR